MNPFDNGPGSMVKAFLLTILFAAASAAIAWAGSVTAMDASSLTKDGIAAYNRAAYLDAIKLLEQRACLSPEDPIVFYYLGNCYLHSKQTDKAAHMYSACVRLSPSSQAGKYALSALESLSATSRGGAEEGTPNLVQIEPGAVDAAKDALMSTEALDKKFNLAVKQIKSHRQSLQVRIDNVWQHMQDELQSMSPKNTPNYATEMERVRREAENTVADLQTRQLRMECRLLAPTKIDARAIPQMPQERPDDAKAALGSLIEYFKAEKPFDPFGADITPEVTAKFMTVKDVFGELSTYQPAARKMAKQVFLQLKDNIESKQDQLDQQLYQTRANLIKDIVNLLASENPSVAMYKHMTAQYHASTARVPRADNYNNLTQTEQDVSQMVDMAKRRVKELQDSYYRDVDSALAGAKEKVGGMVAQVGQINTQLKHPSGTIQLVPLGSDLYVRNYVNFGDRPDLSLPANTPADNPAALKAAAKRLTEKRPAHSAKRSGSK
jgi:tetratricopeptide (TPR) repeat protein